MDRLGQTKGGLVAKLKSAAQEAGVSFQDERVISICDMIQAAAHRASESPLFPDACPSRTDCPIALMRELQIDEQIENLRTGQKVLLCDEGEVWS